MKQMKFADILDKKVRPVRVVVCHHRFPCVGLIDNSGAFWFWQIDMSKVNLETIKPWITTRLTQLLGFEDDVVTEFTFNQLEERVRAFLGVWMVSMQMCSALVYL